MLMMLAARRVMLATKHDADERTSKAQRTILTAVPADAHDARCYGAAVKKPIQLMLMMLPPALPLTKTEPIIPVQVLPPSIARSDTTNRMN